MFRRLLNFKTFRPVSKLALGFVLCDTIYHPFKSTEYKTPASDKFTYFNNQYTQTIQDLEDDIDDVTLKNYQVLF